MNLVIMDNIFSVPSCKCQTMKLRFHPFFLDRLVLRSPQVKLIIQFLPTNFGRLRFDCGALVCIAD